MSDWLILVDSAADLEQGETPHKVLNVRDYLARPQLFAGRRPNIVNLARSYAYQGAGYYASLLAEARGHRITPTVQTMMELSRKPFYEHALPELETILAKELAGRPAPASLLVAFGQCAEPGFAKFCRELFDWFRAPAMEVVFSANGWTSIERIRPVAVNRLKGEARAFFLSAMDAHMRRRWSPPKGRGPARWSLAVLVDPKEAEPPSSKESLDRLGQVAAKQGVDVDFLKPGDLADLAEYDALFIRATTALDNFTYRFARRAEQEGMPVIDDTVSMTRCTNKVYLKELLTGAGVPVPRTEIFGEKEPLAPVAERLGFPLVMKAPDGSFSRSVHKVADMAEMERVSKALLKDTALVLAQEWMPTTFDWRIGVLAGEPLYACQYRMARGHWQIIRRDADGRVTEGGSKTFAVEDAPREVIDVAVKAARLIGAGLYGVDLKQNDRGVFVIEINDNPNLDQDVEGAVLKDELWARLIGWYTERLERRIGGAARAAQ